MKPRRIPLAKPIFDKRMREAAIEALQNERFVMGESVYKFEEEFARYCGTKFAVSTSSGTTALALSLLALKLGGADVITSPASFVASANSIIHAGAKPTFADISLDTYTIDPASVRASLNTNVKALLPVHLYGFPAAMDKICEIASENGIAVVEDACQAHGASYNGKMVGSIGDVGCFSFFPSKNMTVGGDGGMVTTDNESIADCVASLRDCGRAEGSKYVHSRVGFTARLNNVQAAIGRAQLRGLDTWNKKRREIAQRYDRLLSDIGEMITPPTGNDMARPVHHLYVVRCSRRDDLRDWLEQAGIECGVHYPNPIHLQPIYRKLFGYVGNEFPNSETLCKQALSIPMHPSLALDEVQFVSDAIHEFYKRKS